MSHPAMLSPIAGNIDKQPYSWPKKKTLAVTSGKNFTDGFPAYHKTKERAIYIKFRIDLEKMGWLVHWEES